MDEQNQQVSPKESIETRRQEKLARQMRMERMKTARQVAIWVLVAVFIGVVVWGIVKNTTSTPSEPSALSGVSSSDWIKGNNESNVVLVEYSDFQCPACGAYHPVVKQLVREFGNDVAFVYRHFPLRQIHPNADLSARAAEAAGAQGKFWEMHDLLFENQKEWSDQKNAVDNFVKYAESLGLNGEQFKSDIDSKEVKQKVNEDYNGGTLLKISGTPTFFLNGKKLQNPRNYEEFQSIIKRAIEQ